MIDNVINLLAASVPTLVAVIILQAVHLTRARTPSSQPLRGPVHINQPRATHDPHGTRPYDWARDLTA